ncbi:pilin [Halomonas sp. SSL-5]|uniref:pilin n=1 Tax=Halomonas sp. SSL-5 TaxID=3065855 RepID=UPI002738F0D3|nr:pilin [Halomonas sp. SSL-5]MDY7116732.1 pilin [Halomonas sp. SSL-5]
MKKHEMMKTKRSQGGFTLIELMIVVAIVGILAAIAIPRYQDYVARSQVSEGLSLASGLKATMSEIYTSTGAFPTSASAAAAGYNLAADAGRYVSTVTFESTADDEGFIEVLMQSGAPVAEGVQNAAFRLSAEASGGNITGWPCEANAGSTGGDVIEGKYLPSSCQ